VIRPDRWGIRKVEWGPLGSHHHSLRGDSTLAVRVTTAWWVPSWSVRAEAVRFARVGWPKPWHRVRVLVALRVGLSGGYRVWDVQLGTTLVLDVQSGPDYTPE
jgi:hypothetical protein